MALDKRFTSKNSEMHIKEEQIPLLDPRWRKHVQFIMYQSPPNDIEDSASWEEWKERMTFIDDDLKWLLKQSHAQFWCQVVFDETFQRCIDGYLKSAPRSYDIRDIPRNATAIHDSVHRHIFMVCLRMSTHKESKESFITPSVFGDILYENFLFDIPKLMDLCVLYGESNTALLTKMVANIFEHQPRYQDDLLATADTVCQVLMNLLNKCGLQHDSATSSPQKLSDSPRSKTLLEMSLSELQDIVYYLLDTAVTLSSFLEIYPAASKAFLARGIPPRLATVYELLASRLTEAIQEKRKDNVRGSALLTQMHTAFKFMLEVFHDVVYNSCLQPIFDTRPEEDIGKYVESYINIFTTVLGERRFLADLESFYPFSEDRDVLTQTTYQVDETRVQFIEDAIKQAIEIHGKRINVGDDVSAPKVEDVLVTESIPDTVMKEEPEETITGNACAGAAPPQKTGVELDSMISSVKDLLPDLGDGFIEICLQEYNYDMETVLNALLEDRLLPYLQDLDRYLPRLEKTPEEVINEVDETLLDRRANIYDNDEFDVFHREDVDTSKIHMGKKDKVPHGMATLDDKSGIEDSRHLYNFHGHEFVEDLDEAEYEDEYDDTYDSQTVGAKDDDSADEMSSKRLFVLQRVEEQPEDEARPPRDEFVQNPAVLREKREQRRQTLLQKKGHTRTYDVKGKAKGQGQDKDVSRNRAWKEKNKSTRGHHNRRVLADKKRAI